MMKKLITPLEVPLEAPLEKPLNASLDNMIQPKLSVSTLLSEMHTAGRDASEKDVLGAADPAEDRETQSTQGTNRAHAVSSQNLDLKDSQDHPKENTKENLTEHPDGKKPPDTPQRHRVRGYFETLKLRINHGLFYLSLTLIAILYIPGFLLTLVTPLFFAAWFAKVVAWTFIGLSRLVLGISWKVRGAFPKYGPYIVASKHQSLWETAWFVAHLHRPIFFLKKNLLYIPFFGWMLWRLGMIPVGSKSKKNPRDFAKTLKKSMDRGVYWLDSGGVVVIFPEGTRTRPGQEVRYRRGVYGLWQGSHKPIVPVSLNSGIHWPKGGLKDGGGLKSPGTISIIIGPPICFPWDASWTQVESALRAGIEVAR